MKIKSKDFRVHEGDQVDLQKWPTLVEPAYKSKDQYQGCFTEIIAYQARLFMPLGNAREIVAKLAA